MRTRVLITGAAGFIGSHLVGKCLDGGNEVHVAVRDGTSLRRLDDAMREITVHRVDLADEAVVSRCLAQARPHRVFHLASQTRNRFITDVSAMLDAARIQLWDLAVLLKCMTDMNMPPEVFVRSGSIAEYGPIATPFREEQEGIPSTAYSAALLAGTHFMNGVRRNLPFTAITTRLALVYGPGQSEEFLIPRLIRSCINGLPYRISRPDDRRDLLFVDDAVTALLRIAADPPADCGVINVATGTAPSMREVAGQVIKATGADPALLGFAEPAPGRSSELRASPDLARRVVGWSARTSLAEGIADTVARQRHREPVTV
jgi:UDP-glucose 4-epimerase